MSEIKNDFWSNDDYRNYKTIVGEAGGWIFYQKHSNYLFRARPDGSENMLAADNSVSTFKITEIKDGWIYYDTVEEYSESDSEHQEYNRYRDRVTYKASVDGGDYVVLQRSSGYLGSSD